MQLDTWHKPTNYDDTQILLNHFVLKLVLNETDREKDLAPRTIILALMIGSHQQEICI
jgi:hypothetical protein